ncbi:MAG: hypothetical protein GC178_09525 [Flavobacteriales bacterium]|nr:hypothetical protein [Flavobacteriales bacterium]
MRFLLITCFMGIGLLVKGQSEALYLSEADIQRIIRVPEKVDQTIRQLEQRSDTTSSLAEKVSLLHTAVLLESYSRNANCELSLVYDRISELLMQINSADAAIRSTHKAMQLADLCGSFNEAEEYNHLGKLGSFFLISDQLDSALYYFRRAENYADTIANPIWHASSYNNLGMVWTRLGNADSAFTCFNNAIFGLNAAEPEHQRLLGNITDNLAQWHQVNEDANVALQLYNENIKRYLAFHDSLQLVKSYLGKARSLMLLGSMQEAKTQFDSVYPLLFGKETLDIDELEQAITYWKLFRKLNVGLNDSEEQLRAADSTNAWQQRYFLRKQETQRLMITTLIEAEFARVQREWDIRKELRKEQRNAKRWFRIVIVVSIMLLLLSVWLGYCLYRKK